MHIQYSCAYRLPDGQIEGFRSYAGLSGTRDERVEEARLDAWEQIHRKLKLINMCKPGTNAEFDPKKVIESPAGLTAEEMEKVRRDWACGLRY